MKFIEEKNIYDFMNSIDNSQFICLVDLSICRFRFINNIILFDVKLLKLLKSINFINYLIIVINS